MYAAQRVCGLPGRPEQPAWLDDSRRRRDLTTACASASLGETEAASILSADGRLPLLLHQLLTAILYSSGSISRATSGGDEIGLTEKRGAKAVHRMQRSALYKPRCARGVTSSSSRCRRTPVRLTSPIQPRLHNRWPHLQPPPLVPFRLVSRRTVHAPVSSPEATQAPPEATAIGSPAWQDFTENASGEWEGITATFNVDGEPVELPHLYVPQAFRCCTVTGEHHKLCCYQTFALQQIREKPCMLCRDWGQTLYDWHTQCSTLLDESGIHILLKRMVPTVGCGFDCQCVKALTCSVCTTQ